MESLLNSSDRQERAKETPQIPAAPPGAGTTIFLHMHMFEYEQAYHHTTHDDKCLFLSKHQAFERKLTLHGGAFWVLGKKTQQP